MRTLGPGTQAGTASFWASAGPVIREIAIPGVAAFWAVAVLLLFFRGTPGFRLRFILLVTALCLGLLYAAWQ